MDTIKQIDFFKTENVYHQIIKEMQLINSIDKIENDNLQKNNVYHTVEKILKVSGSDIKQMIDKCNKNKHKLSKSSKKILKYLIRMEINNYKKSIKLYEKYYKVSDYINAQPLIKDKIKIIKKNKDNQFIIDFKYIKKFIEEINNAMQNLKHTLVNECKYIEIIDVYTVTDIFSDVYISKINENNDKFSSNEILKNELHKIKDNTIMGKIKNKIDSLSKLEDKLLNMSLIKPIKTIYNRVNQSEVTAQYTDTDNIVKDEKNGTSVIPYISSTIHFLEKISSIVDIGIVPPLTFTIASCLVEGVNYLKKDFKYGDKVMSKSDFINIIDIFCNDVMNNFIKDIEILNNDMFLVDDLSFENNKIKESIESNRLRGIFKSMDEVFNYIGDNAQNNDTI